jgi:hypothetical protein
MASVSESEAAATTAAAAGLILSTNKKDISEENNHSLKHPPSPLTSYVSRKGASSPLKS